MRKSVCSSCWSCIRDQFNMHISSSLFTKFQVDEQVRSVASDLQRSTCTRCRSCFVTLFLARSSHRTRSRSNITAARVAFNEVSFESSCGLGQASLPPSSRVRSLWLDEHCAQCSLFFFRLRFHTNVETRTCSVHCLISACGFSGEHCCTHITTRCSPILVFSVLSRLSKRGFS